MLDIKYIKENKTEVEQALLKRMKREELDLDKIISLDDARLVLIKDLEEKQALRNKESKSKPSKESVERLRDLSKEIKKMEEALRALELSLKEKLSELANIPAKDLLPGGKENNEVIYTFSKKPEFAFKFKDHVSLAEDLELIDYKRAVKIAGTGFWAYKGLGAHLEWALLSYFKDFHTKNNYQFVIPPFLLNEDSAYASGHLPKFRDDLFWTQDKLCLNATSEMMMGNYHRDEILKEEDLPLRYFSYSPCFRREAGAYRKEERGMIRGHQFNKIEMFVFCEPKESWKFFDELVKNAQSLVEGLDLHYQLSKLAAGDTSSAMAKTYDIEVWLPSMGIYKEVSSASNALDYQARRGNMRYKTKSGENLFLHTLNASGLATSRLIPAILEQNQREDGSVLIPKALQKYMPGNLEIISAE